MSADVDVSAVLRATRRMRFFSFVVMTFRSIFGVVRETSDGTAERSFRIASERRGFFWRTLRATAS
jgi:hypothetical protein